MPETPREFFERIFQRFHAERSPYPWQADLFERAAADAWPDAINAPTGSGKTAVMTIWLAAVMWQAKTNEAVTAPRRLVWVVNRRVVVDQATEEAEGLLRKIEEDTECSEYATLLGRLSAREGPRGVLTVSTLRGERADNRAWALDASRPAIIVGTVDMIGSRLLFSGYGDGRGTRAHHAGLLGSDSLIVNDEAHLSPAFAQLIQAIRRCQGGSPKPCETVLLSATMPPNGGIFPSSFSVDEQSAEVFRRRFRARKRLRLLKVEKAAVNRKIVELAFGGGMARRVVVFVDSPEQAFEISQLLSKQAARSRIALMTGEQRGHERDEMVKQQPFVDFLCEEPPEERCWLVATSAAEVGVDLSSCRMITTLATADHLLQRFGRLNRFGETEGEAIVIYPPDVESGDGGAKKDREGLDRLQATLAYLRSLEDVSPATLFGNSPAEAATEAAPRLAKLEKWLVERWANTSIESAAQPEVEPWLHGQQDKLPRTAVAWRAEIPLLTAAQVEAEDLEELFARFPIAAHEKLEAPTYRIAEKLRALVVVREGSGRGAVLLTSRGQAEVVDLAGSDWRALEGRLRYGTLVLPPGVGGLENGMFDPSIVNSNDVAEVPRKDAVERRRFLAVPEGEEDWLLKPLTGEGEQLGPGEVGALLDGIGLRVDFSLVLESGEGREGERAPMLILARSRPAARAAVDQELGEHQRQVAERAEQLAVLLGAEPAAFQWAGLHHDDGKAHALWQEAMCGSPPKPLAKSKRKSRPKMLGGMRHELVSLLRSRGEEADELGRHLIAAHHGWGRPNFRPNAGDPQQPESTELTIAESVRRFAALQEQYGAWGLAWLEAVFRSADWQVSAELGEADEEGPSYA